MTSIDASAALFPPPQLFQRIEASFTSGELRAVGRVAKAGKRIIVTTAEVTHLDPSGKVTPCALMQQMLVPGPKLTETLL